ncbi:hypothetical protein AOLI_G00064960 [Acnodon oligacanthus]
MVNQINITIYLNGLNNGQFTEFGNDGIESMEVEEQGDYEVEPMEVQEEGEKVLGDANGAHIHRKDATPEDSGVRNSRTIRQCDPHTVHQVVHHFSTPPHPTCFPWVTPPLVQD